MNCLHPSPSPTRWCLLRRTALLALPLLLAACATVPEPRLFPHAPTAITAQADALLPADAILLGE
jgi:hypothetical protein